MEDMHIHLKEGITNQEIFNQYVDRCISLGIKKAVFLDHGNRISSKHEPVLYTKNIIDLFNEKIIHFSNLNKSKELLILRGIEIDYSKDEQFEEETKKILKYANFEWVIGAIHSMKFSNLNEYLETVIDMLKRYKIDAIAHLKLDDKFKENENKIIKILQICNRKNVFIEINTSDRSRWNDEQLYYMLNLMEEYNVNYVFSSDAHNVNEIGYMIGDIQKKVMKWKNK